MSALSMVSHVNDDLSNAASEFAGVCPHCGSPGRFVNMQALDPRDDGTYAVCDADAAYWHASPQWYDDAPSADDPETWWQNIKMRRRCIEVAPFYPKRGEQGAAP